MTMKPNKIVSKYHTGRREAQSNNWASAHTKNEIISWMGNNRFIENIINRYIIPKATKEDITQDLYTSLLLLEELKLKTLFLTGQIDFFVSRMISNQIKSYSSISYRKYRVQSDGTSHISIDNINYEASTIDKILLLMESEMNIDLSDEMYQKMVKDAYYFVYTGMSEYNQYIFQECAINKYSLRKFAKESEIKEDTIEKVVYRAKKKMKTELEKRIKRGY